MIKLDKKDKRLLYELSKDARTSHTQLGRTIKLSKSSVKYRIDRLKELGVIEQFSAIISFAALRADTAIILIRFNEHIDKDITDFFKNSPHTDWVITLSGQWDLLAEVAFRSMRELNELLETMRKTFSERIRTYELIFLSKQLRIEHLIRDFYKELNITTTERVSRTNNNVELDQLDRNILRQLSVGSESSIQAIAHKTEKTVDTISARMKNLVENGVLIKCFAEINVRKLGYTEYLYKITLHNLNQEKIAAFTSEIKRNENIKYAFLDITGTCIILHIAFSEARHIDEFTSETRRKYHDILETQEYYLINEQLKFDLCPVALLDIEK